MKREAKWYIDTKLKPPKEFFEWCDSQIHTFKWSNKQKMILASERKGCEVIERRLTKRTNLTFFDKFYTFAIILVTSKRIEIQTYAYWSEVRDGKQFIDSDLVNFERLSNGERIEVTGDCNSYYFGLSPNQIMGGPYTGTRFYQNDFLEKIKTISELKYISFDQIDIYGIRHFYKYRNEIEFLQKIKARRLAEEVMYPAYCFSERGYTRIVDMRTLNQKWLRENKAYFKNSDHSFLAFELEKRIRQRNGKLVPGIENYLTYKDIKKIPKGVGMVRFQNWVIKNKVDFTYYLDYLGMLSDLSIDPTNNENLIIPKDLEKAHDNAVRLLNILFEENLKKIKEKEEQEYREAMKSREKLQMTIDGFAFMVPEKLEDLIKEGKELHHCVGSSAYVEKHRKGQTTILFIRKVDEATKPLFTLEYKSGEIIQIRGKHNVSAPPEVVEVANKWVRWVSTRDRKGAVA